MGKWDFCYFFPFNPFTNVLLWETSPSVRTVLVEMRYQILTRIPVTFTEGIGVLLEDLYMIP